MNHPHRQRRLPPPEAPLFARIAAALEGPGVAVLPNALPPEVADALLTCLARHDDDAFHDAGVGRGPDADTNPFVRRNEIRWIADQDPAAQPWLAWCERLRSFLNQRLYLGLFSFESHFARYRPGDFYKRHIDAFRGEANRVVSVVTYLNRGWLPDQGGELVIYDAVDGSAGIRVSPAFGTLVVFLSEGTEHEVLPAVRERYSVSGWFRLNTSLNGHLDPPR